MANKVILMGRLGRDPEVTYTPNGMAVCKFSLATSEYKDKTEWHQIVAFGKTAELCGEYLSKGNQAYFEGRLQTSSWEKDGKTHYKTEVVVDRVEFIGGRESSNPPVATKPKEVLTDPDDDIPF